MRSARGGGPPERPFALPALTAFDSKHLDPARDYDALDFVDLDLTAQNASDARFLDCRFDRCRLDDLTMRRARILGSLFSEVLGTSIDWSDSTWRDSRISGGRLGAAALADATWTGVRVRGIKLDYLNLAGASLDDVVFEACEIGALDARAANLESVWFVDCRVEELNITEATLSKVDLSGARLRTLVGVDSLRGASISQEQLVDLAPMLAAELGIKVRPDDPEGE